jgi:segregation and condensation protein B
MTATNEPLAPDNPLDVDIEAILLVAVEPVSLNDLVSATDAPRGEVHEALSVLKGRLTCGIRLQEHEARFQLVTAPESVSAVQRFLGAVRPAPLSRAALETLAVIAYRQPVTRTEIEEARGVDSDRSLRTLLMRELVEELGRRPTPGRPAEYGTTVQFLEYFGLGSLDELPPIHEDVVELHAADLGFRENPS